LCLPPAFRSKPLGVSVPENRGSRPASVRQGSRRRTGSHVVRLASSRLLAAGRQRLDQRGCHRPNNRSSLSVSRASHLVSARRGASHRHSAAPLRRDDSGDKWRNRGSCAFCSWTPPPWAECPTISVVDPSLDPRHIGPTPVT
jgi:hypothetical protein